MKHEKTVGVDVGNFDVKTQNVAFPSGLDSDTVKPFGVADVLEYGNRYWYTSEIRPAYTKDKTTGEGCFALTLIAVAKEIIYCAESAVAERKRQAKLDGKKADRVRSVQDEILDVDTVRLGVGLPPTHVSLLSEKLVSYYKARFGEKIEYTYAGYRFSYSVPEVKCFPQDFAAIITYHPQDMENSALSYPTYYGIDIGGWTVDVVTVINGRISIPMCDSKPLGVLAMCDKITREAEVRFGKRLSVLDIETVLKDGRTLLKPEIIQYVKDAAGSWYGKIMAELKQFGLEVDSHPVIFLGGGALLLKPYITADSDLVKYEIIYNPKANAAAYASLMG